MKPPVPQVLEAIAERLGELSGANDDPVLADNLMRISVMVRTVAGGYDVCVSSPLQEADQLMRWLAEAAASELPERDRAAVEEALRTAETQASELRVSAVEARLETLRRATGNAQSVLEARGDGESRRLLAESWQFLGASLRRDAWMGTMW